MQSLFFAILLVLGFSSCEKTVTYTGGNSNADKVNEVIEEYKSTLTSASNGWILEVETSLGYYQFYTKYTEDNKVTMYTDNMRYQNEYNGIPKTSTYNIRSLQRPTLSFDTYNYISIINDPDNSISGGQNNQGLKTDFEFEFESYEAGVFELKGRVNRVHARLRKASAFEAKVVQEGAMMNTINNFLNYEEGRFKYFTTSNGVNVSVDLSERIAQILFVDAKGNVDFASKYTLALMDNSVKMVNPFLIEGEEFTALEWKNERFFAQVGDKEYELKAKDEAIFKLHELLGKDKRYQELYSYYEMYTDVDNVFYDEINAMAQAGIYDMSIMFTEANEMQLQLFYNGQTIIVTYSIEFNEDRSQFLVTALNCNDDPSGLAESAVKQFPFVTYWLNKSFTIEWSNIFYRNSRLGEIKEIGGNEATYYGGPF